MQTTKRKSLMLQGKSAITLQRLATEKEHATLSGMMAHVIDTYDALDRMLRRGDVELALVNPTSGTYTALSVPGLTRAVVRTGPEKPLANIQDTGGNTSWYDEPPARERFPEGPLRSSGQAPKADRLQVARAAMEAAGGKPVQSAPTPDKKAPWPGMLSLEQAAERMLMPASRLLSALKEVKFDEAMQDADGDWWIPATEAKPPR